MFTQKASYIPPLVIKSVVLLVETGFLAGSVVDDVPAVQTAGQEKDDFIDTSSLESTFNATWGDN